MAKIKVKKGDLVEVVTGRDRGKQGKVISVDVERERVLVEGVRQVKRHTKVGSSARGSKTGGIITQEAAMHISNVMLVDPETKKRTRVGYRTETVEHDGRKRTVRLRVAKRSGKDL